MISIESTTPAPCSTKPRFGVERTPDFYYPIEVWDYSLCQPIARFKDRAYAEEYVIWLKQSMQ